MEESIISWNVTNWVTIILMAAIGFFILGLAQKAISKKVSGGSSNTASTYSTSVGGANATA